MLHEIISAEYLYGYSIKITFENGRSGIVDFSEYPSRGGVFSRWADPEAFQKFRIDDETKNIIWESDIDLAPETLYAKATGEGLPSWMENSVIV